MKYYTLVLTGTDWEETCWLFDERNTGSLMDVALHVAADYISREEWDELMQVRREEDFAGFDELLHDIMEGSSLNEFGLMIFKPTLNSEIGG